MSQLSPEDLKKEDQFELLAEVEHSQIKQFILDQITPDVQLIRWFLAYQVAMVALFVFLLVRAIVLATRSMNDALLWVGLAVVFSFTVLIVLHELLHALAYWFTGSRNLKVGAIWKKFVFYVVADRQVIDACSFRLVAYAPLVAVKLLSLGLGLFFWSSPSAYFFFGIMCIHSLFCAGDVAMLAFYQIHAGKEIYNYDDVATGKSFFYYRTES